MNIPRVAFFSDSFHEVNGVARTCREFARFAHEKQHPFFSVRTGPETRHVVENAFETYELKNSPAVVHLEKDLSFDCFFLRHRAPLLNALSRFRPDLIHVTGPSHCGFLGVILAHQLRIPLVASWHTNLHEYAEQRFRTLLSRVPDALRDPLARIAGASSFYLALRFYRLARLLFAPNPELVEMLALKTGRPTHRMHRGIDSDLFSPERRERSDEEFVIGYVGRLSAEKNVRMMAELERVLVQRGIGNYRFLIVGDGSERSWLAANMKRCQLPGILLGTQLARAYANMDAFVFPSRTDTFGNVVLEAMTSGVPPIVTASGGPKYLIDSEKTGYVAQDVEECACCVMALNESPALRRQMAIAARAAAAAFSWNAVFERVYQVYGEAITSGLLGPLSNRSPSGHVLSNVA